MKVVLRSPIAPDGVDYRHSLTLNGVYEVLGLSGEDYQLLNNKNEPIFYAACCFEVVDCKEPVFWVSEFGSEGERYAGPAEWSLPGFFEDFHDHNPSVKAQFFADLVRLYPWTVKSRSEVKG